MARSELSDDQARQEAYEAAEKGILERREIKNPKTGKVEGISFWDPVRKKEIFHEISLEHFSEQVGGNKSYQEVMRAKQKARKAQELDERINDAEGGNA